MGLDEDKLDAVLRQATVSSRKTAIFIAGDFPGLASGLSNANRLKDLADVQELIKSARLPRDLGAKLNASVRAKFDELWVTAQTPDPLE